MSFSKLLEKYNVQGPRYTSYPTVPYWSDTPNETQWLNSLLKPLEAGKAALYVHIPFCEQLCTFCGCNTRITRNHQVAVPYIQTLLKEIDLYLKKLGLSQIQVKEVHLGGGTPTFLHPDELKVLFEGLLKRISLQPDAESSIEVDPRITTQKHLEILSQFGFKRISLGVQDFEPKVQNIVNRVQSSKKVQELVEEARRLGFSSVNFDLIYGLPFQSLQSITETFRKVIELKPDRIAFYSYAHVPWIKPSHRKFTDEDLPSPVEKRALYERGRTLLEESGYFEIGMDHFALQTDSLWTAVQNHSLHRNFMGYISRKVFPLIGLGVSAISDSWTCYVQNEKHLEKYAKRVEEGELPILRGHLLSSEDLFVRKQILSLMTEFETSWEDVSYSEELKLRLKPMIDDGLVSLKENRCVIRPQGKSFLRNICMAFDLRLLKESPQKPLFSQTV